MVHELAGRANLPMPKVYIMDNEQPNAFATGRYPKNAAVAVTTSLVQRLSREESRVGVVAHELAHIKNHDTLIRTICRDHWRMRSRCSAQFSMFFGGNRDSNNGMGIIGTLAMVILAPIAAMIVQMAISRTREYSSRQDGRADRRSSGQGYASALRTRSPMPRRYDPERAGRARSGDGAHVHHQPAVG